LPPSIKDPDIAVCRYPGTIASVLSLRAVATVAPMTGLLRKATPVSEIQPALPRLTYLVKQAELAIRSELDRIIRRCGVTTLQYTALSVLDRSPGLSSAQLARRSFVTAQAGNEMIASLERKGLIERYADTGNRRILSTYLTAQGRAVLGSCDEQADELEARMLASLGPVAQLKLRRGLEACVANLR
jgi:DNA-binding MarR family transcriptional regulator